MTSTIGEFTKNKKLMLEKLSGLEGWTVEEAIDHTSWMYSGCFYMVHTLPSGDKVKFYVKCQGNDPEKAEIIPCWLRHKGSIYRPGVDISIKVSPTREKGALCRDIKKRFIDRYLPLYEQQLELFGKTLAYEIKTFTNLVKVMDAIEPGSGAELEYSERTKEDPHREMYVGKNRIYMLQVSEQRVDMRLSDLSVDQAVKVIELLKTFGPVEE